MIGAQLLPGLATRVDANLEHEAQFGNPVRAASISGNLFVPMPEGTAVEGRMRARTERHSRPLVAPCRSSPTQGGPIPDSPIWSEQEGRSGRSLSHGRFCIRRSSRLRKFTIAVR